MLAIETENLTKKFKESIVVNSINSKINKGKLFALNSFLELIGNTSCYYIVTKNKIQ